MKASLLLLFLLLFSSQIFSVMNVCCNFDFKESSGEEVEEDNWQLGQSIKVDWNISEGLIIYKRVYFQFTGSNTYLIKLNLENFLSGNNITVWKGDNWNVSTISPYNNYNENSSHIILIAASMIHYEILFNFESSKQYLAISEFKSYDFEGSGGSNLNSTIVSSGAFSERKTSGNLNFEDDDLPEGYYYADIDCYIETAPTAVVLQYYDGSSWINATSASVSITDRWQQLFAYLHPTGVTSGYTIRIVIDDSGVVFYDDINFNTVNHEVETSGYRKIKVSGQLRSWDGYDNPSVPSEDINVSLWDRTAGGSYYVSENKTTDSEGSFSYELGTTSYSQLQDQRENAMNVTAYNSESSVSNTSTSYFTSQYPTDWDYAQGDSDLTWDADGWGFSEETVDSWTGSNIEATTGYLQKNCESGAYASITVSSISIEADSYDTFIIRAKSNATVRFRLIGSTWATDYSDWLTSNYQVLEIPSTSGWTGTQTSLVIRVYDEDGNMEGDEFVWFDYIRVIYRDTPSLSVADSYAWITSSNNSFVYRTEVDNTLQGYYPDLEYFSTDQSIGSHTINATVYDDLDRSNIVFLPGSSVTGSYSVVITDDKDVDPIIQEPPVWFATEFAWFIWTLIWAGAGIIVAGAVLYYFLRQLLSIVD